MTEQIEDDFWAAERARDTAARGQHADPAGCGTCKASVAAGGQVKHDECAKRATLLPAPDAPSWELITGLSEEELAALPARFHVPAFIESSTPKAWVCAVCWGDGWSTRWPCKTALEQGLHVFTAEDYAETAAKRQAVELEHLRTERDGFRDQRNAVFATNQRLIGEIEAAGQVRLRAENETRTATREAEQLRARVAELEAERKKYVGDGTGARITQYAVSALPEGDINAYLYEITVDYRGHGLWAVTRHRQCLGSDGEWDWEPIPSERDDDWLAAHRFDEKTALELAKQHAPHVVVNRVTAAEALRRAEQRAAEAGEG